MRVLLDTHALLWWASSGASRLSATARELIEDASTVVLVSAASAYEIAVKTVLGRLDLPDVPDRYVPALLERHHFLGLPVDVSHALRAGSLPSLHRDPWDRLLIAQAQLEGIPLVSADPEIDRYEVDVIW